MTASNGNGSTYHFKLVLLGESAVGKSSLVLRFVRGRFMENQESTIGGILVIALTFLASFLTQSLPLKQDPNTIVKFEIWDTAGQERYHSLAPMYYRGAHAAIVVYDITSKASYEKARDWIEELRSHTPHSQKRIVALVGNKLDRLSPTEELVPSTRTTCVSKDEAEQFASENGLVFYETSAKVGTHVQELFETIAELLPKNEATKAAMHRSNVNLASSFGNLSSSSSTSSGNCC